ncbi:MAG: hypothetical protein RLZZ526_1966, partial [Actinomycetota bacterium]
WVLLRRVRPRTSPVLAVWFVLCAAAIAVTTALVHRSGPIGTLAETPGQYMSLFGRQVLRTDFLYLGTFSRASGLFLGAALAMVWRPWALVRRGLRGGNGVFDTLGVLALVALGWMCWTFRDVVRGDTEHAYDLLYRGGLLMVGIASVVAIMAVTKPRSILGRYVLGNPVLVYVGTRSYGLYLYHWPIFQLYRKTSGTPLQPKEFAALMIITLAVTEMSYRWFEYPIRMGVWTEAWHRWRNPGTVAARDRKRRISAAAAVAAIVPLFAVVSMATAKVVPDDITANLNENENAVVTIPTIAPRPTVAPGQTTVPMPTTSPPKIIDVLAVGDSVMLGSAKKLSAKGFVVDAAKNRQPLDALQIFNYYRATKELGSTVIIHLGTNGTTKPGIFERLMKPLAEVKKVIVLTIRVPTREYEKINNDIIYALPNTYKNVTVLDWYTLSKDHPEWFAKDKVHPNAVGQDRYVEAIVGAMGQ